MQIPLQIALHGIRRSDALVRAVRRKAAQLERHCDRIVSCRVVLEADSRHKHKGRRYAARIDLKVARGEIAVTRARDEDLHVALRDAFDAARRQLEDRLRNRRDAARRPAARRGVGKARELT